jgi:putative aldouronate transport system permease protein
LENWKRSRADLAFDTVNVLFFTLLLLIVIYPIYFILISSVSSPDSVNSGQVWLLPQEVSWDGYMKLLKEKRLWNGYENSIVYTLVGTAINVVLTIMAGYALSRKDLIYRNAITIFFIVTMFFNGGLIPTYLLVKGLGMVNTIWALVLPGAVSVFQLIIVRTFFQSTIPDELLEAAVMDGSSNTRFFLSIVLPLSLPIIAVIVLFNAVAHWNSYFNALIYIRTSSMQPLQVILRELLIQNESAQAVNAPIEELLEQQKLAEQYKYAIVIVASLPVLVLYPFLQKYFVKGMMIGSVKG